MHIEYLDEFVVLASHMNISKAAKELNMTQSNLSKHIRQLENELGVDLISHGIKIEITPAGLHFLDKIRAYLGFFEQTKQECLEIQRRQLSSLVIRHPTFNDAGALRLYQIIDTFRSAHPEIPIQFDSRSHNDPASMIGNGEIDIHITYEYGSFESIAKKYADLGFSAFPLLREQIGIWCPKDSSFAQHDHVEVPDLQGIRILETNQKYGPFKPAIDGLFQTYGMKPEFDFRTINSFLEMVTLSAGSSYRIFPMSLKQDIQLQAKTNMTMVPIGTQKDEIQVFFLLPGDDCEKESVVLLKQTLDTI